MRVATIDLGTNSTRLLVADVDGQDRMTEVVTDSIVTRMGEGVDASGRIGADGIERVLNVLDDYARVVTEREVERSLALLTSAGRDAENGGELAQLITDRYGIDCRRIEGDAEAQLVYRGATFGRDHRETTAVLDVGGGSTELATGGPSGLSKHVSTQIGVVRHTERFLHSDPPTPDQIDAMRRDVAAEFSKAVSGAGAERLLSVGGTPISCASMLGHQTAHGTIVTAAECGELLGLVVALPADELRQLQGLQPARAPAIVAGLAIHLEALAALGATSFEVSEHDLRHGAAIALASGG